MKTPHKQNLLAVALVGALTFTTTVAQAQTSRFVKLANAPFKEDRPTKETAQTLRDELLFQRARRRLISGRCRCLTRSA